MNLVALHRHVGSEPRSRRGRPFRASLQSHQDLTPYGERPFVAGHAIIKALGTTRTFCNRLRRPSSSARPISRIYTAPMASGMRAGRAFPDDQRRAFCSRHRARRVSVRGAALEGQRTQVPIRESDAISLLLVGDGVDEHEIRGAARGVNGIVFWPFVQARDLTAYYAASDVFVFPTLGDPWGQVIEEAHAAGLPIITTSAVGEVRQRVVDGTTGFVVPPADTAALAKAMLTLAGDPGLRRSMGERGRERVKMWGHDTYVSEMEHLVSACLTAPRRTTFAARGMSAAGTVVIHTASAAARARKFCQ